MKRRYRDEVRRVAERAVIWTTLLGLDDLGLHVTHRFTDALSDQHDRIIAETTADWEYRQASIVWYLPITIAMDEDELDRAVVHELVHVLVAPIEGTLSATTKASGKNEYAVETVTRAILACAGAAPFASGLEADA